MGSVDMKDLEAYIAAPVQVCIHGEQGEEMAPWVDKKIKKLTHCPDGTHLRIYFDHHYFFAVPLSSDVELKEHSWSAYDQEAGLYYVIKSEGNRYEK